MSQYSLMATGGMVVAPHHLAAQAGRDVLRDGGNAIQAMVAAAATIAVVYPHMNALGGDGFWLIHEPGKLPRAIDASGVAGAAAQPSFYAGLTGIPTRGPGAALTVAGTVSGWMRALELAQSWSGPDFPLERLLQDAIRHAREGVAVTTSQAALTRQKFPELQGQAGFAATFLDRGQAPQRGHLLRQPALAETLQTLAQRGLDDFYRGQLGDCIGAALERLGSPLTRADLAAYEAQRVAPLHLRLEQCGASLYNLPPSSQGIASLIILALYERLQVAQGESFDHVHGLVEATKRAFRIRNRLVTDPGRLPAVPESFLVPAALDALAQDIHRQRALPWPEPAAAGDTIWMGAVDDAGRAVSFIQSVYWEFGAGIVLEETGLLWQNRGISFSLEPSSLNALEPGRHPFHTLNPALALFDDGRVMPYGTMGGEGQPQTQAAVFTRYALHGQGLQQAITAPRWVLGRTWGDPSTTLKLENRFDPTLISALQTAGHVVDVLPESYSDTMGHAGALVHHPGGLMEGAVDPRSDGAVCAV